MRVDIEKRHLDSYEKIAREANKAIKKPSTKVNKTVYEKDLLRKDISAENKKKRLASHLHELIIRTFSININEATNKKKTIEIFKANLELIRYILHKIESINNYIEEDLLRELGIIKKSLVIQAVKSDKPIKYLERSRILTKNYFHKLEHTVYELMGRIVFFDKRLLKDYEKKEIRIISKEKFGIKDLEVILKIESELLDILEAKIPPSSKVKARLFRKDIFSSWVPMVFALLSSFEAEYGKEELIFLKIKKDNKLRNKIDKKIKHIVDEKEKILKMKENRALSMKNFEKINDDYRQTFQDYISASSL